MKILILAENFPYSTDLDFSGGVEARSYFAALALSKEHEVTVIAAQHKARVQKDLPGIIVKRVGPVRSSTHQPKLFERWLFLRKVIRLGKSLDSDLVEGTNFLLYQAAISIAKSKRIPSFCTYHDVWIGAWRKNLGLLSSIIGEIVERRFLRYPWTKIISVSTATRAKLLQQGVAPGRITVIPNGVDLSSIPKANEKFPDPSVIYVGRLVDYKRVADLIEAVDKARAEIPKIQLRIVGEGPNRGKLEALTHELGIHDRVHFHGFVEKHSEVLELVGRSHVFCLPSTVEGFGIVLIEAMALRTPYICSELPPTQEVTENGVGGILYPPGNIKSLTEALLAVLTDSTYAQGLGQAGQQLVVDRYDWAKVGEDLRNVYRNIK